MKFLVYTVTPHDDNAALEGFEKGVDKEIYRIANILPEMNLARVMEHGSISALVDNVDCNPTTDALTAEIYKEANPDSALHQLKQDGDEVTIQEILSEHEDAFAKGFLGMRKIDGEVHAIVEKNFGSYFVTASIGLDTEPHYSADSIRSIQNSETIGKTELDFDDDYNLTASLFKPPEDRDIRENEGFGNVDVMNKILAIMQISRSHRITLDIQRDEWLDNVEMFEELIQSDIISTIRIKDTRDGTVKIGDGGDRAIRETITTSATGQQAIGEAFDKLSQ